MLKHRGPNQGRHHGPAGLHQLASHLQEMRDLGFSAEDIHDLIALLKVKLPKGFAESAVAVNDGDEGASIAQCAEDANRKVLDVLRNSLVLIAGEMRPHLISPLLDEGVSVTQVHDVTPHGHRPPHFRDLARWYPARFCGVLSFTEVKDAGFTAILIDVFLDEQGVALASPLAMMASRLWPEAKVVAVLSDHCAPHHVGPIGRNVDLYLYWE
ncbi:MAG: hypothetical protein ABIK82_03275 [Pseudomonadota bacterium]